MSSAFRFANRRGPDRGCGIIGAVGRRNISRVLAVLAFAFGVLATLFVYAQDRIFDADAFAAMASASLSEPSINEYLADRIAEQILVEIPDLAVAGSLVEDVTASTLRSSTAATIVEVSARDVHQTVFDENSDSVALEVSDLVITVTGAIEAVSPELAASPTCYWAREAAAIAAAPTNA